MSEYFEEILNNSELVENKKLFYDVLKDLSDVYYESGNSKVTDDEFDLLKDHYEKMHNQTFNYIGSTGKNVLPIYLGSLNKCKDDHSLDLFKNRCSNQFVISEKIDGISILLEFDKAQMRIYTRGDGYVGQDISQIGKYLNIGNVNHGYIQRTFKKEPFYVRGELVIKKEVYNEKYKELFKNPRNMVSGVINSKEIRKDIIRDFTFVGYYVKNDIQKVKDNNDMFYFLKSIGFNIPEIVTIPKDKVNKKNLTKLFDHMKDNAEYDIDGLVISDIVINSEKSGENPKYTIAFKSKGEEIEATVEDVEWNVTKHRIIKPKVKIIPVNLSGTTITYLSGFNAKFIVENGIGKGSTILITRSGDVIPHIIKTIKRSEPILPKIKYDWSESKIEIICLEKNTREEWVNRMICLFDAVDIKGVKEGILTKLYDAGISDESKLLSLDKNMLIDLDGVKDKSAENILSSIQELKQKAKLDHLMIGSCKFQGFGEKKLAKILDNLKSVWDYIINNIEYNEEELSTSLNELGFEKTCLVFVEKLPEFKEYYDGIKHFFNIKMKSFEVEEVPKNENSKTFVFSGFRDSELEEIIKEKGDKVEDSLTKSVHYLVVKDITNVTNKMKKAEKYGTKIITKEMVKELYL